MKFFKSLKYFSAIALLSFASISQASVLKSVESYGEESDFNITINTSKKTDFKYFQLKNPHRLVVDMKRILKSKSTNIVNNSNFVKNTRIGIRNGNDLRIVFELSSRVDVVHSNNDKKISFKSKNNKKSKPVINKKTEVKKIEKLITKESGDEIKDIVKLASDLPARNIVIVIDAGHGGKDPGAIGPNKLKEKDVNLAISKEIARLINKTYGFKALMVRNDDRFVKLHERRNFARRNRSDLFVSIHADAFTDPKVSGASIYTASTKASTSAMARYLAKQHTRIGNVDLTDVDDSVTGMLADMGLESNINASRLIAKQILPEMDRLAKLHSDRVEGGNFAVLKSPDVPSILVETGFISNPKESRKLANTNYQKKMARHIYKGIMNFFHEVPPMDTKLYRKLKDSYPSITYKVKSGDSLSVLAEKYGVTMKDIMKSNNLRSKNIRIGQRLTIKPGRFIPS